MQEFPVSLDIENEELLARWVFSPRNIDPYTGKLKDNFIFLRQGEKGISCYRYDKAGREATIKAGLKFCKEDELVALALATAGDIRGIDLEHIQVLVSNPLHPLHVEIRFTIEGALMKGIIHDAYVMDLLVQIKDPIYLEKIN